MLVPAILYKEEIIKNLYKFFYTEEMTWFSGWIGSSIPNIEPNIEDSGEFQYAIIDKNNQLIGFFSYYINWYNSSATRFKLFSFDKGNSIIGFDVYKEMKKLIYNYKIHRIEYSMVGGNPVEKHYDKFCNKFGGHKFIYTDTFKDKNGKYHNAIDYEIIFNN